MLHFDSSHSIVIRGSRAQPKHTLPALLNLTGRKSMVKLAVGLCEDHLVLVCDLKPSF